jgi:hypothetical protein
MIDMRSGGGEEANCVWDILQDCRERLLVTDSGAAALERKDDLDYIFRVSVRVDQPLAYLRAYGSASSL